MDGRPSYVGDELTPFAQQILDSYANVNDVALAVAITVYLVTCCLRF